MRNVMGVFWVVAAAACGSKNHASTAVVDPASGDPTTGEDDASVGDEPSVVPCGPKSCNAGEYCCDGTCGACAAVGTNCPADSCASDGAATDDGAAE
jgi:hypothetical protein